MTETDIQQQKDEIRAAVRRDRPSFGRRLDGRTASLYGALSHTLLGRWLTSYKRGGTALFSGRPEAGADTFRPLSPARSRAADAMERSLLLKAFRALFSVMGDCPALVYGLFFVIYGILGIIIQLIGPFVLPGITMEWDRLILFVFIAVGLSPLLFSRKSIAGVFGAGALGRLLAARLLGIPKDRLDRENPEIRPASLYIMAALAVLSAGATIWIHPLIIPLIICGVGFTGMVLTYPETGVVLASLMLPVMWVWDTGKWIAAGLILLTWVGYGVHVLSLHRTFRLGRLDGAAVVLGLVLLIHGLAEPGSRMTCLLWVVLLSGYVLAVNLMNTRAAIRRCLTGVVLSLVAVLLLGAAMQIPGDFFLWMETHWLGAMLSDRLAVFAAALQALPSEPFFLLMTLLFPWLCAFLFNSRRPLTAVLWTAAAGLGILTLVVYGTPAELVTVCVCFLLFCLFFSHRTVTVGLFVVPLAAVGGVVVCRFLPVRTWLTPWRDRLLDRLSDLVRLWRDAWSMIVRRPAGVGPGREAFAAAFSTLVPAAPAADAAQNVFLDLLAAFGWPGLVSVCVLSFLFWQKGLSCLSVCRDHKDRAWIAAGLATAAGLGLYGLTHSLYIDTPLFFTLAVLLGLCSAHQSIVFDEQNVLMTPTADSAAAEERLY